MRSGILVVARLRNWLQLDVSEFNGSFFKILNQNLLYLVYITLILFVNPYGVLVRRLFVWDFTTDV